VQPNADILQKAYPKLYMALLYGAECTKKWMVPIPLDYGSSPMISLDDLATDCWLKGGQSGGRMGNNLADLTISRTTIAQLPSQPTLDLDNAFTIIRPEMPILRNRLVENLYGPRYAWMGDLLIVKHENGSTCKIEDMTFEDHALIDLIIKWCALLVFAIVIHDFILEIIGSCQT